MIKAQLSNGALFIGLSDLNIEKLKENRPIVFDGRPFGFQSDVIIVWGTTEEAIARELLSAMKPAGSA